MTRRLYISASYLEIEKPAGGGHGPDGLKCLFVAIDGQPAMQLDSHNFKQPGQMTAFYEILREISARDISESARRIL